MDKGWQTGRERFKYYKPERWSRWPFAPPEQVEETGAVVNEPPGGMPPTEAESLAAWQRASSAGGGAAAWAHAWAATHPHGLRMPWS